MNANPKIDQDILIESGAAAIAKPHEGMTLALWRRFRRHPGAVAGMIVLSLILLISILAQFSPYDPEKSSTNEMFQAPSMAHPFGTDSLGRDLLTRVLYGGRISIAVGLMVVVITLIIGVPVGAVAGHFGGWVDNVLMRITDAVLAFPPLLVLIMLSAVVRDLDT
jgi:peptide/nickel transport system permease protein